MDYLKYLNAFIDEANENVHSLNRRLLELEQSAGGTKLFDGLYRAAHTLKASSQTMGFHKMAGLSHAMEYLISGAREGRIGLDERLFDLLFRCVDCFESFLFHICEYGCEGGEGYESLLAEVTGAAGDLRAGLEPLAADAVFGACAAEIKPGPAAEKNAGAPKADGLTAFSTEPGAKNRVYEIKVSLIDDCLMKAARAYIILASLERRGAVLSTEPKAEEIEDGRFGTDFSVMISTAAPAEELRGILAGMHEVQDFAIFEADAGAPDGDEANGADAGASAYAGAGAGASAYADAGADTGTGAYTGAYADANAYAGAYAGADGFDEDRDGAAAEGYANGAADFAYAAGGGSARVDVRQLDALQLSAAEMTDMVARLSELLPRPLASQLSEAVLKLGRNASGIEGAVAELRTAPLAEPLNRMKKICGNLAAELGKEAELKIAGGDARCDVRLISSISQALTQIIRNSVDHGIEPPAERVAAGKPRKGAISIEARSDDYGLTITVEDDGAGIASEKLIEKAIKRGVLGFSEASGLSREELLKLPFLPSFTTREDVSIYSGRGVGLDIVKAKTEKHGGKARLESEVGRGTKVTLTFPRGGPATEIIDARAAHRIFGAPVMAAEPAYPLRRYE